MREAVEEQRRFPLKLATVLSQQFASHGLQFFKVNRTVTHVSVARPRYLDMDATPVSEGVKRIVEFINSNSKCTRRKLFAALAPAPVPIAATAPVAPAQPAAAAPAPESTPEQTALASDLHWLVHEGHVIEFANGILETAKKPLPRPPKPEKKAQPSAETSAPSPAPSGDVPDLASEGQVTDNPESATVTGSGDAATTVEAPGIVAEAAQPATSATSATE